MPVRSRSRQERAARAVFALSGSARRAARAHPARGSRLCGRAGVCARLNETAREVAPRRSERCAIAWGGARGVRARHARMCARERRQGVWGAPLRQRPGFGRAAPMESARGDVAALLHRRAGLFTAPNKNRGVEGWVCGAVGSRGG
eukprot:2976160-Prymnesium_polylepis.1